MKRLQKNLRSTCAALICAGLSSLAASGVRAELKPVFDELKLYNSPATLPTIEVAAEGKDWTEVTTQSLHVTTHYYVSLKKGGIVTIVATFGNYPLSESRHPGGGKRRWGEFRFEIANSQMGVLKHFAIDACNQKKKAGARTDETHTAYVPVPFTLFVRAERVGNQATKTADGEVQAKVVCKKAPRVLEISHLDVRVDDSSDTCPKNAVVEVGFNTNRGDPIHFTLEHENGGLHTSEHVVQPYMIDGQYVATKLIDLVVDSNTEFVRVRLKDGSDVRRWSASGKQAITCPRAFKVTSAWLSYDVEKTLQCPKKVRETARFKANAPGRARFEIKTQAGLVVHSGTADFQLKGMEYVAEVGRKNLSLNAFESDMMADVKNSSANSGWVRLKVGCMEVQSGTLDLRTFAASRCEGEAVLSIRTNMPGKVPYRLECTGGRAWDRKVQVRQTGSNTFVGVDVLPFDVSNNELVRCALRTRKPLPFKILAGAKETYECHKPTGVSGSEDLAPETRPDPRGPRGPRVVIDPPRPPGGHPVDEIIVTGSRISCADGTVKNGSCHCPRTHERKKVGKNSFRCVEVIVDPVPGGTAVDSTPGQDKSRHDAAAERRRLEALKKRQEAKKRATEAKRKKAAQKAAEAKRKREAAKKAAEAKRKRKAAKKAAKAKRKRKAAKHAEP